ncbi:MAG: hypothetical protein GWM98_00815, partial [Nitrospinaceae bacterium]|nr:hypothetical protein [Nitrospinaceae bacterium]
MTIGTNEPIPENHFSGGANLTGDQPGNLAPMLEAMRLDVARSGETTEDMDIWVSPLGDDTTGEGTESEPYRTPTRAFRDIPFQINHSVHVRFAGGTYTDFPSLVYHRCGKNGALFLEGLGLPTPSAGPFTVSSYSLGVNFAYTEIQVLGAGWSVDQFYNKWVRVTAGTAAGLIFPIFKNSADTIVIPATFPSAGTVTEIEILDDPTVTMDVGTGKVVFDTGFAGNGPSLSIGGIKFKSALDGFPFRVQASKIFCA